MDAKRFVAEIYNRPSLWKSKHPHYRFKNRNARLWEEVRDCFPGFEVEQLKKKWKNLKDSYRKELKKSQNSGLSSDDETSSQWKYFKLMSFLKDEFNSTEEEFEPKEIKAEDPLDVYLEEEPEVHSPLPKATPQPREVSLQPSNSQSPHPAQKRSKADEIRAEYLEIEKKKLKILEQEVARQGKNLHQNAPDDISKTEDYHFLMSLLPEMQKLPPIQKMRLRNKMNQCLLDEMEL